MPAVDTATAPASTVKSENQQSIAVLDELMTKLSVSKNAGESSEAANNIATFINGAIEEQDAPTK